MLAITISWHFDLELKNNYTNVRQLFPSRHLYVSVWCSSQFSARHFKCTIRELFSLDVVKISNELKKTKKPTFSPSEAELLSFFKLLSHSKDLFSWTDLIFFYWILNEFVLRCGYLSEIIWNAGFLFKP